MEEKQLQQILKKMDGLIKIVALSSMKDMTSTAKIALLSQAGFAPKDIADILNTSQNVVNVRLSEMRKGRVGEAPKKREPAVNKEAQAKAVKEQNADE